MSSIPGGGTEKVRGIIDLTRYKEYVIFVIVTTFLGAQVSGAPLDGRLLLALVANWLAVGFSFMINDVEDADDDALNPAKAQRNPVSAGRLDRRTAYVASFAAAILAGAAFYPLGPVPFWLGVVCLVIGFLYSWRPVRLKRIPIVDLISHSLLLAGLQYLCAYFTFASSAAGAQWIAPFVFVMSISMYGELFNEVRDLEGDLRAGVTHTAAVVGEKQAHVLMVTLLAVGGISFAYSIVAGLVPWWVLVVLFVLAAIILARPILKMRRGSAVDLVGPLHVPAQIVGALTMIVWVAVGYFAR